MVSARAAVLLLAGLGAGAAGCRSAAPAVVRAEVAGEDLAGEGGPAVWTLDGRRLVWGGLLAGRPATLVVFATTWCAACREEQPAVEAWARAHPSVPVLYVFSGEALQAVRPELERRRLGGGAVTAVVDVEGGLADRYRITATPTLLLVGADGRPRQVHHRVGEVYLPGSEEPR